MTKKQLLKELDPIINRCMKMMRTPDPEKIMGRLVLLNSDASKMEKGVKDNVAANAFVELALLTKLMTDGEE